MDHAEEAAGELVVAGGECAVNFEVNEHALDTVALLVERPVMLDRHLAILSARDEGFDLPLAAVGTDRIGVVALVGKQGIRGPLR